LKGANFESNDRSNRTPLSQAVGNGHEEVVKLLIKEGANFQSKNGHETVMRLLVEKKGHEVLVKLLIEKGANLESDDRRESNPPVIRKLASHH
jgi:ankyrin repeat protein